MSALHSLNEDQIHDIITQSDNYSREYFIWQMDEANSNLSMEDFFNDDIFSDLDERVVALMQHTGDYYSDCESAIYRDDYLVLTDNEADIRAQELAEDYASDAKYEIPEHLRYYFDEYRYIEDQLSDGRGILLAHANGEEYEEKVNETVYFIYKR